MPGSKPTSRIHTLQNPLARMLPIGHEQAMTYRMGEKRPPSGHLDGYGPIWEPVTVVLGASGTTTQTLQARVNFQRDFTLLSVASSSSSSVAGGFRGTFFDVKKKLRFFDRPINEVNLAGQPLGSLGQIGVFFLREPYRFDQPDSQILLELTNLEAVGNTVQVVFYGLALRFNEVRAGVAEFPGGNRSSLAGWQL